MKQYFRSPKMQKEKKSVGRRKGKTRVGNLSQEQKLQNQMA